MSPLKGHFLKKKRSKRVKPWDKEYYVARKDCITIYLWIIKRRSTKEPIEGVGGWISKESAELWLSRNWQKQLEKDIENILLVND
jgi:hypothetical protein